MTATLADDHPGPGEPKRSTPGTLYDTRLDQPLATPYAGSRQPLTDRATAPSHRRRPRLDGAGGLPALPWLITLRLMGRYPSTKPELVRNGVFQTVNQFLSALWRIPWDGAYAGYRDLVSTRMLKRKYYLYASYLAGMTSYPILRGFSGLMDVPKVMFAKAAAITGMKVLDNLNDKFHSPREAIRSLTKLQKALTSPAYEPAGGCPLEELAWVERAENSACLIAGWAYETLRRYVGEGSLMLGVYLSDVRRCIEGQMWSLDQRLRSGGDLRLTLEDYLERIVQKEFGTLWVDIDFCFYEEAAGGLSGRQLSVLDGVRRSVNYFFQSSLVYDDICDLEEDMRDGIVNSVVLLGVKEGLLSEKDLEEGFEDPSLFLERLNRLGVIDDALRLGDLLFLRSLQELSLQRGASCPIDLSALDFSTRFLRLFVLRKWIRRGFGARALKAAANTFRSPGEIEAFIPSRVRRLEKYMRTAPYPFI